MLLLIPYLLHDQEMSAYAFDAIQIFHSVFSNKFFSYVNIIFNPRIIKNSKWYYYIKKNVISQSRYVKIVPATLTRCSNFEAFEAKNVRLTRIGLIKRSHPYIKAIFIKLIIHKKKKKKMLTNFRRTVVQFFGLFSKFIFKNTFGNN